MNQRAQDKFADLCHAFNRPHEVEYALPAAIEGKINEYHAIYCSGNTPGNYPARTPLKAGRERERDMLDTYLKAAELALPEGFLDRVMEGDDNVFELYDFAYAQVYRSASFLSFKTFSLIVLMLKSNFELYDRDAEYIPLIQAQTERFIANDRPALYQVPAHRVWERTLKRQADYYWDMKLGHFAPVYSRRHGRSNYFFVSHRTRQIFADPFKGHALKLVRDARF